MYFKRFAVVFLTLFLSGCSVYRPKAPIAFGMYRNQVIKDLSDPDLVKKYNDMPEGTTEDDANSKKKVARRNQILNEFIWLIDQNYAAFENRFYGTAATMNVGGDFVNIGLTATSAVTGSAHLKSVLSAAATGATGLKASIDKNLFDQQTRSVIVSKMRALRADRLSTLQDDKHMKNGLKDYSLEAGLGDVDAYFEAGTVVGALQDIAAEAGKQTDQAAKKQQTNSGATQKVQ